MCSLKGSERSQTESQSDAVLPQSIFAHTETSVHLCALSDSKSLHSRLQTATMATHAHQRADGSVLGNTAYNLTKVLPVSIRVELWLTGKQALDTSDVLLLYRAIELW